MKILHIVPSYIPAHRYGGPIESVHNLNAGLVKNGAEVTIYTTDIDGDKYLDVPIGAPVIKDGVRIYYFKGSENRFLRSWFYSSGMRKALAENGKQFDIFHITSTFLAASTLGAYYAKKFRKPYVISPRGNLMAAPLKIKNLKKKFYIDWIEKRNLAGAAGIHFTVEKEKSDYLNLGLLLNKAILIPNIYEPNGNNAGDAGDFRKKFNIADNKKIVIFMGRLHRIKGLDTLIPAFAEVVKKEPLAVLVLAGGDENNYKKEIELKIENCKLKIGKDVIFTGMITGNNKANAYSVADIFVMPSYSESFGMAAVEAMSVGLPVIVTKGVGLAPYINQANAGAVVEKNESDLSEAILSILKDKYSGKEMGKRGKEMIEKEFSQDVIAKKFIKEYELLIKNYQG